MMNDLVNSFKSAALSVGEMLTPVLKESKFRETGVLTPEEFVAAGDHLVHLCPTWSWSKASAGKGKDFLPPNKQFLVTKHVPCHQRCNSMLYDENMEKIIDECGTDGGLADEWVDTHHFDEKAATSAATKTFTVDLKSDAKSPGNHAAAADAPPLMRRPGGGGEDENDGDEDEDEDEDGPAVDMDNFLESGALEDDDPNRFVVAAAPKKLPAAASSVAAADDDEAEELERTRTYDLHITYDKYYQVPRFWLVGYDEQGQPLNVKQMKEDFSQEHADRTITLESHPHVAGLTLATIHPCRHAEVMKRLIEQFLENGKQLSVLDYLFVFLKFVQAVIPTVEYDYTRSIQF